MSINDVKGGTATVVMFICNHCPFVKHVNDELVRLGNDYNDKGIGFVAISSNDVENYPDDSPGMMKIVAQEMEYPFPYLYDETQEVAKAYDAACTPDFYVFDKDLKLVYRGQLDDSRPGNDIPVTGKDLRSALNAVIDGKEVSDDQKPSLGCNIKWKQPV
jgi:thiol-disulfide isomerase/thioredoxin